MSNSEKRPGFKDDKEKVRPDLVLDGMSTKALNAWRTKKQQVGNILDFLLHHECY